MSRHSKREISMFEFVSVTEQANLNITLSETPKTGFVAMHLLGHIKFVVRKPVFGISNWVRLKPPKGLIRLHG